MNFKTIAAAALLAVTASASFATTVNEGVNKSFSFNDTLAAAGSFSDSYVFQLTGSDNASLGIISAYADTPIDGFSVKLTSTNGFTKTFGTFDSGSQLVSGGSLKALKAGTYTLTVSGIAAAGDNFGGSVSLKAIPAVPEPANVAMLLAGLGCMGFIAKRRKQG